MKVGIVTYNETPYRKIQFNKFSEIENLDLNIYYCKEIDRDWKIDKLENLKEIKLKNVLEFKGLILNKGLLKIIKENDYLIIGGYDQITYIVLSLLCKILRKKYSLLFDGISCNKINQNKKSLSYKIKKFVIGNSQSIFGNGTVSRLYFETSFNIDKKNIYNQYLTVDGDAIISNNFMREELRSQYRKLYKIKDDEKVILYSGRIVTIKNIEKIVIAISLMQNKDKVVLFITGDGENRNKIENLAKKLKVKLIITGFISEQNELFKHYYIADVFTLMSTSEPWGLVINEAMYAKLPLVISDIAGASLDLVKDGVNGFTVNPNDEYEIAKKYNDILKCDLKLFGENSFNIIKEWNFENSKKEFYRLLNNF